MYMDDVEQLRALYEELLGEIFGSKFGERAEVYYIRLLRNINVVAERMGHKHLAALALYAIDNFEEIDNVITAIEEVLD